MANTEHIEARLCAYVDGELDAAGRAEIEAHLQANPQHRQLLAELVDQRQLLRSLPREKAPDDLTEAFQSQLERSVLFNQDETHIAGRINRWPPIVAAAVLLLSVGLVTIIYFILPDHRRQSDYARLVTTAPASDATAVEVGGGAPTTALAAATPAPSAAPEPPAGVSELPPAPAAPPPDASAAPAESLALSDVIRGKHAPEADLLRRGEDQAKGAAEPDIFSKAPDSFASNMATSGDFFKETQLDAGISQRLQQSADLRDNSMLVLVSAGDTAQTNRQVTEFLTQNSIRWEPLSEPMPEPVQVQKHSGYASKMPLDESRQRMSKGGNEAAASAPGPQRELADKAMAEQTEAAPAEAPPPLDFVAAAPSVEPEPAQQSPAQPSAPSEGHEPKSQAPAEIAQAPSTALPVERDGGAKQSAAADAIVTQAPAEPPTPVVPPAHADNLAFQQQQIGQTQQPQVIVARGLTREQLDGLFTCVSIDNESRVGQYNRATGAVTPTTQSVVLGQLQSRRHFDRAATQLAEVTPSIIAGAATQPLKLESSVPPTTAPTVVAVDAREAELKAKREASDAAAPADQESPTVLTPAPVPAEIAQQRLTVAGAATAPATQSLGIAGVPSTQPSEEPIDVVIVLQPQAHVPPPASTQSSQ